MKTLSPFFKNSLSALVICTTISTVQAQFASSVGFDYTSGKYGLSTETKISTINVTGEYMYEAWSAKLVAPYERVTSPVGVVVINGHPKLQKLINSKNQGKTQSESGLGDVEAFVSYNICYTEKTDWSAVVTGSVKLPTANDENGLGTGKTDYGLAFDLSRSIGHFTPSLGFGYRFLGNPSGADLKNYFYGTVGLACWVTDDTNLSLTFESDQRSSVGTNVDNELSFGVNHHIAKGWDAEAHALVGLSQAAPAFGLGASIRYAF